MENRKISRLDSHFSWNLPLLFAAICHRVLSGRGCLHFDRPAIGDRNYYYSTCRSWLPNKKANKSESVHGHSCFERGVRRDSKPIREANAKKCCRFRSRWRSRFDRDESTA
jgi:hypothetical protein